MPQRLHNIAFFTFALCLLFLLGGCHHKWTQKEKNDLAIQCSQTDSIENLAYALRGFQYEEVKTILVKHIKNNTSVDSFYIHPDKNAYDSMQAQFQGYFDKAIYLHDSYQFIIDGERPYVLSNIKMTMRPRWTMLSENYGCEIEEYTIDSVQYKNDAYPVFVKRNKD